MNTATAQRQSTAFEELAQAERAVAVIHQQHAAPRPVSAIKCEVERVEDKIFLKLRTLAKAAGSHWYYRYPVKNKKTGKVDYVEGPSIKCALTVARLWGNSDIDVRAEDRGDHWMFYARFVDFETGWAFTRAYQQRKSQDTGMKDTDRAMDMVFQIGQSKAIRNTVCNALSTFTDFGFEEAKLSFVEAVGKDKDTYRARILDRLKDMGIELRRVEASAGRPAKDWLAGDMARIIAELQAINDNMASIDDTYPLVVNEAEASPPQDEQKPAHAEPEVKAEVIAKPVVFAPSENDDRVAEWVAKRILDLDDCETQDEIAALYEQVTTNLTQESDAPLLQKFLQKKVAAERRVKKAGGG